MRVDLGKETASSMSVLSTVENIGTMASLKVYIVLTILSLCHVSVTQKNLCDILSRTFDIIIIIQTFFYTSCQYKGVHTR